MVRHGLMLVGPTGSGKTKVGTFNWSIIATVNFRYSPISTLFIVDLLLQKCRVYGADEGVSGVVIKLFLSEF